MAVFSTGGGYAPEITFDEHTLLLLHGEDIVDSSMYERTITNHGVAASEEQSVFGGKSLYLDGKSYLTVDIPHEGDMTIDFWMRYTEFGSAYPTPINWLSGDGLRGEYVHAMPGALYFCTIYANGAESSGATPIASYGEWTHLALVRTGTTVKGYVNGVEKVSVSGGNTANSVLWVGQLENAQGATWFKGYIEELRVSGIARWTENFDPPINPYKGVVA